MAEGIPRLGVLVVDDSEDFLGVACSWIESQPSLSLVGTARNGAEARDLVDFLAPDLVIIDAFMPVVDGFAATRSIKSRRAAPWVVMVSMHDGTAIEQEARDAGADAFVAKSNLAASLPSVIDRLRRPHAPPRRATNPAPTAEQFEDAPREQRFLEPQAVTERVLAAVRAVLGLRQQGQVNRAQESRHQSKQREESSMKHGILKGLGVASLAVALTTTATFAAGGKTTFTSLGPVSPWAANYDGTKIVGSIGYGEYFYWTAAEGVVPIGGGGQAGRVVISGDGNVIAGSIFDENGIGVAATWKGGTDWETLGGIPGAVPCGNDLASAWGIDYYGQTLVGLGWLPQLCNAHGTVWDLTVGGDAADLGTLVPNRATRANAISGDGHTIVGWQDDEVGNRLGAIWVDGVESFFTTPAGENVGEIEAVNSNATAMVGVSYPYGNGMRVAWVWTARKGFRGIDSGPVYAYNVPTALNEDGSVVGGLARELNTGRARAWVYKNNTFIWLTDYLNNKKKIAPGWIITSVSAVSADGTTIIGEGLNPSGFLEGFVINNF